MEDTPVFDWKFALGIAAALDAFMALMGWIDLLVLRGSAGRWIFLVLPSTVFLFFFIMRSFPFGAHHYYANMLATCYLLSGIVAVMARWAWLKMF